MKESEGITTRWTNQKKVQHANWTNQKKVQHAIFKLQTTNVLQYMYSFTSKVKINNFVAI